MHASMCDLVLLVASIQLELTEMVLLVASIQLELTEMVLSIKFGVYVIIAKGLEYDENDSLFFCHFPSSFQ